MSKRLNLLGKRFGKLTVINCIGVKNHCTMWRCLCDCGNYTNVYGWTLVKGNTKSCGCLRSETLKHTAFKHGKTGTRLHNIYRSMLRRCHNKNDKDYGGRGIAVCSEWKDDFMSFYDWAINNGYEEGLSIDRIDNNKGYGPSNCRWATRKQQNRNTRQNKFYTINGETHCLSEWCEIYNIAYKKVYSRLRRNWTIERALELEVK